jgi:uroporphyrinogen decarboxylase
LDLEDACMVNKPILDVLNGRQQRPPPIWLMRQAGRYLPEYRAVRERADDFLALCFTPALAAEVTLQPVRRFNLDAAILFSDILVVPHALGQRVWFSATEGPQLDPVIDARSLARLKPRLDHDLLAPVYETVERVKLELPDRVALLGFCGAPWTVATYMVAGRGTPDQEPTRLFAYREPAMFALLMDRLVEASACYLIRQFRAGVDAVQIFDTWAGMLPAEQQHRWCIEPARRIVLKVREAIPGAKVIGFPRGIGSGLMSYLDEVPVDAVSLDWTIDLAFAGQIQRRIPVQGNLDPVALLAGGEALDIAVERILQHLSKRPFIFNLGHGILPQTPIAHVKRMLSRVRGSEAGAA